MICKGHHHNEKYVHTIAYGDNAVIDICDNCGCTIAEPRVVRNLINKNTTQKEVNREVFSK